MQRNYLKPHQSPGNGFSDVKLRFNNVIITRRRPYWTTGAVAYMHLRLSNVFGTVILIVCLRQQKKR